MAGSPPVIIRKHAMWETNGTAGFNGTVRFNGTAGVWLRNLNQRQNGIVNHSDWDGGGDTVQSASTTQSHCCIA